jgi:hypothetical protein
VRGNDKSRMKSNGMTPSRTADEIIKENDTKSITRKGITVDNERTKLPHNPDESIEHTTVMNIVDPSTKKKWPLFSLLNIHGELLPNARLPVIEKDLMLQMYKMMTRIKILDDVFFNAQRQGRISFYMQNTGEEAIHIGIDRIYRYTDFMSIVRSIKTASDNWKAAAPDGGEEDFFRALFPTAAANNLDGEEDERSVAHKEKRRLKENYFKQQIIRQINILKEV